MAEAWTARSRMLAAYSCRKADRVAVSPDMSNMMPVRLSGRPFDEMYLDSLPHAGYTSASVARAYVQAVRHFGFDGMYIYGSLPELIPADRPSWTHEVNAHPEGGKVKHSRVRTPTGQLSKATRFFVDEPPWELEKPVKDLRRDWPRLCSLMGEPGSWQWSGEFSDAGAIGELGVYAFILPLPQDWWFGQRDGNYNTIFFDYLDDEAYMREVMDFYTEYALAKVRAGLAAGPDEVWLGGSASSLSVSSLEFFRRYDLPFIRSASAVCREAGIISHLHVCGRSAGIAELVAEETDVNVIEPLEGPPGGDVDIAAFKRRYGHRVCLKGNLNTFDFMLHATPAQVAEEARRLIDACADGGGFVLSTGDQCARDTPEGNIFALVEVADSRGRY
jgi:uroporphyrinogen decarboxylase